ncbi:MAG: DUF6444 domain-containing protein, partial [Pseudomonadota bacterium]|nr:DUF6444 domain-containing protein [Pseudomonadota bacterium]
MFRPTKLSVQIRMLLGKNSLRQIDEAYIHSLSHDDLIKLSTKLLDDLKEARERLDQNPKNSSRPPSTQAPWVSAEESDADDAGCEEEEETGAEEAEGQAQADRSEAGEEAPGKEEGTAPTQTESEESEPPSRKAGKQKGAPGYGRTQ